MIIRGKDSILPVIGLEIHVQLATETKLFCRCRNSFGDPPNSNVCPVCLGLPGALPVLNAKAVEMAMKVGLALNCQVADITKWDRKSYYYPDLPKNYQISQYDLPLTLHGFLEIRDSEGTSKNIRVLRAHLEEDAGKNIHDNPRHTGVDLNRAGIPLLEIVSEPDMNSTAEVLFYARSMQRIVRWLGVSEANMEMGQVRFEPNINLHVTRGSATYRTPIVEVKNLNSFRSLERTVDYEIERQYGEWQEDPDGYSLEKMGKQNLGFDVESGMTVFQRQKEEAHDYRYFPDPDLVPVRVTDQWRESVRSQIGELPWEREARYERTYGLKENEISALTIDRAPGDLYDRAIELGGSPRHCVRLLMGKAAAVANQKNCSLAEIGLSAEMLADLSRLLEEDRIVSTTASRLFDRMIEEQRLPLEIAEESELLIKTDPEALNRWIVEAVNENPQAKEDVLSGGKKQKKAFGFLMGQVMQKSKGTAPPPEVQRLLKEKLGL